jgi:hypothetical protein
MDQQIFDMLVTLTEHLTNLEKIGFVFGLVVCFALGFHKGGQR